MRRRAWILVVVACVVAIGVFGGASVLALRPGDSDPSATSLSAPDLDGRLIAFDVPPAPGTIVTPASGRLTIPTVGLDVPLGGVNIVAGAVTPPGFDAAYVVSGVGQQPESGSAGTVFVVMHSVVGGRAPGNLLVDDTGKLLIDAGAIIVVDGHRYRLESSSTVAKPDLARDAALWSDQPGRLVLITCLQKADRSPSEANLVLEAVLLST